MKITLNCFLLSFNLTKQKNKNLIKAARGASESPAADGRDAEGTRADAEGEGAAEEGGRGEEGGAGGEGEEAADGAGAEVL